MRAIDHVNRAMKMLSRDADFRRGDRVIYGNRPAVFIDQTQENEAEIDQGGYKIKVELAQLRRQRPEEMIYGTGDYLSDAEFKKAVVSVAREIDADSDKEEVFDVALSMGHGRDDARQIAEELRG